MDRRRRDLGLAGNESKLVLTPKRGTRNLHGWYSKELGQLQVINQRKALRIVEVDSQAYTHEVKQSEDEQRVGLDHPRLPRMIVDSLDPFILVAQDVSSHQRSLIQFYVRDLATTMFSTTSTPLYSPTAATGIPFVSESKVAIQWICIIASEVMYAMSGQTRDREISRQWAQGYRALSTALRQRERHFQEAMMGIAMAGLTQYAFGDTKAQNLHATAADRMIYSTGSVANALALAPDLEPFYFAAQFGFGRVHIATLQKLEGTKKCWQMDLKFILTSRKPSWRMDTSPLIHASVKEHNVRQEEVIKLAIESTMYHQRVSSFALGMQLALLSEVAWIIIHLKERHQLAISVFKRMQFICMHSMIGGRSGLPTCELRGATLAAMLSRARRDALLEHAPHEVAQSDADIIEMQINALKMFYYLSPAGQDLILARISEWLTQDEMDDKLEFYDEGEIENLSSQVTETWYKSRKP